MLLNIAPDHIDHHGTFAEYTNVKNRIKESGISTEESNPKKLWSMITGKKLSDVQDVKLEELPHRRQHVLTRNQLVFINDSKATNLHALEAALRSQSRPTVLIAGGKEKELDYTPLLPALEGRVRRIVVFGELRGRLVDTFCPVVRTVNAESLKEAVQYAREASEPGGTVLFSPGTSSFDMFSGYEERGDAYRKIVKTKK